MPINSKQRGYIFPYLFSFEAAAEMACAVYITTNKLQNAKIYVTALWEGDVYPKGWQAEVKWEVQENALHSSGDAPDARPEDSKAELQSNAG